MIDGTNLPKLYKYTDISSAQKILENRTVKLSSPTAFNDPFDTHLGVALGQDINDFVEDLVPAFFEFVSAEINYSVLRPGPLKEKIIQINQSLIGASNEKIAFFKDKISKTKPSEIFDIENIENIFKESEDILRDNFSKYGIFCASEIKNSMLMWSHYADQHRGVVFEIVPSTSKDSVLLLFKPMNYSNERPAMYKTARDIIRKLALEEIEFAKMFTNRLVYTKSSDWSYEAEWRVYIPNFVPNGTGGEFLELHPEEITALFFGCRTPAGEQEKIRELAKRLNPNVKFHQMTMAPRAYVLESERLLPEPEPGR